MILAAATFALIGLSSNANSGPMQDGPAVKPTAQEWTGGKSSGDSLPFDAPRDQAPDLSNGGVPPGPENAFEADIVKAARAHALPVNFFMRLIWQESRFKPHAVSRAGAQGIAQFMPGTARWRGLDDPFEVPRALEESARWLRELWSQFGNLGLAAAAYNAGPERVTRWLSGRSTLPSETRSYVTIITGEPPERWSVCAEVKDKEECPDIPPPAPARPRAMAKVDAGAWGPWGLQLVGDWSEARALSEFRKLQTKYFSVLGDRKPVVLRGQMAGRGSATWYRVRVAEATRQRASELCGRLERAGGNCLVLRN